MISREPLGSLLIFNCFVKRSFFHTQFSHCFDCRDFVIMPFGNNRAKVIRNRQTRLSKAFSCQSCRNYAFTLTPQGSLTFELCKGGKYRQHEFALRCRCIEIFLERNEADIFKCRDSTIFRRSLTLLTRREMDETFWVKNRLHIFLISFSSEVAECLISGVGFD